MEAEQVIEKILADARAEAEKIKRQFEEKQAAQQAELDQQLSQYNKQTEALAQKTGEDRKMRLLAAARMNIAKELLAEKTVILDEVFSKAKQQLQSLSDDEYRKLITKLMLEAVETGDEEVIVGTNETRINQDLIKQVNQKSRTDRKANLTLSDEKDDIAGGFILKREKIRNNVSFEVLLAQARKELEIELAKELFGK